MHDAVFEFARASGSGQARLGCRSVAQLFNLAYADCGVSVSKSFVYGLLKDRAHALALARLRDGNRACAGAGAIQRT